MEGKHMMPDGHMMSDKEMTKMMANKKMKKKPSKKNYSMESIRMVKHG